MNTSLYVLTGEYREAAEKLSQSDLDEQTIQDTLEGLAGALEVKATHIAMFVKNLQANAVAIKAAEAEMAKRRKTIEARAERIQEYLKNCMIGAEIVKIEHPYFNLSIKKNPPSVVIDAESQIPDEFMNQPEPPAPTPNKELIAEALKSGVNVSWAHIERKKRLEIR